MFNEFFVTQVTMTPLDADTSMATRRPSPISTAAHFLYFAVVLKKAAVVIIRAFLRRLSNTSFKVDPLTGMAAKRLDWDRERKQGLVNLKVALFENISNNMTQKFRLKPFCNLLKTDSTQISVLKKKRNRFSQTLFLARSGCT